MAGQFGNIIPDMYRRLLLLCLILCIGFRGTVQDDSQESESSASSADTTFDFFDFPLTKFFKQMDQLKEKVPMEPKPKVIEPEAEMLPAHQTGIKPPGVDHMELIIADTRGANSDDNIYVISLANTKSLHNNNTDKKDGKTPKTVMEHSEQRTEMKSLRNYIYENISNETSESQESNGEGEEDQGKPKLDTMPQE